MENACLQHEWGMTLSAWSSSTNFNESKQAKAQYVMLSMWWRLPIAVTTSDGQTNTERACSGRWGVGRCRYADKLPAPVTDHHHHHLHASAILSDIAWLYDKMGCGMMRWIFCSLVWRKDTDNIKCTENKFHVWYANTISCNNNTKIEYLTLK